MEFTVWAIVIDTLLDFFHNSFFFLYLSFNSSPKERKRRTMKEVCLIITKTERLLTKIVECYNICCKPKVKLHFFYFLKRDSAEYKFRYSAESLIFFTTKQILFLAEVAAGGEVVELPFLLL